MDFVFVKSQRKGMGGFGSIYARVRSNGYNRKYAIGLIMKHSEWEKLRYRRFTDKMILTSLGVLYHRVNLLLKQVENLLDNKFDPESASSSLHNIVSTFFLNQTNTPEQKQPKGLLLVDFFSQYIDELDDGTRTRSRQSTKVSEGYLDNLRSALAKVKEFETATGKPLYLSDVTMSFQRQFVRFLREKGLMPNTITTRMACIRSVMQVAFQEKKTRCMNFMNTGFVPLREDTDKTYLKKEDVKSLENIDLSTVDKVKEIADKGKVQESKLPRISKKVIDTLRSVIDVFLVGCYSGQRISDYSRISNDMLVTISNQIFIKLKQKKTRKTVLIPYDSRIRQILDKYNGRLPSISRYSMSRYLCLVGQYLGFDGKLTSHTARRTFATNAYASGVPLASIMTVTGHSSEKSLRTYLRLSATEKAVIAARDFKGFIQ